MWVAIETTSPVGGVALVEGGAVLAERVLGPHQESARELLPALDALLRETGRKLDDAQGVALSIGPGSFTGLRIGLATALGLCFRTARRIVPVPTLAALALRAETDLPIVPMLDARKRQVYAGVYDREGRAQREDCASDPVRFLASLDAWPRLVFLGSGATLYRAEIERRLGERASILDLETSGWPRASCVGLLGERLAAGGAAVDPAGLEPRYLRASQAELEPAPAPLDTPPRNA